MDGRVRRPERLGTHDYGASALYFVTVVTRGGACVLWDWRSVLAAISRQKGEGLWEEPILSECGEAAKHYIGEIERHYAGVKVEELAILPNHVHMLIRLGVTASSGRLIAAETTLPTIMQQMKQAMTKHLGVSVWARTYIDRIVRSEREAAALADYIRQNPRTWHEDSLCPVINRDGKYEWIEIVNE